jgi:hypothetical protein
MTVVLLQHKACVASFPWRLSPQRQVAGGWGRGVIEEPVAQMESIRVNELTMCEGEALAFGGRC